MGKQGADASMDTEYAVAHHRSDRETVEAVAKWFPDFDIDPSFTLVVKAIDFIKFGALVVAPQHKHHVGVLYFEGQEQTDTF